MAAARAIVAVSPHSELIWASPCEGLNIFQADAIGCHIITFTNDILKKLDTVGKDLHDFSLETVKMFRDDALHRLQVADADWIGSVTDEPSRTVLTPFT